MTDDVDLSPTVGEIVQEQPPAADPPVAVQIVGPVRSQALSRVSAGIRARTLDATTPVRLLTADPSRAVARLITNTDAILIAGSAPELISGAPGTIPAALVVEFTAADEVWAMAASGTATVTVVQERWANG